jgi:hypothetical protein
MVDRETFDLIKKKHGACASWAAWSEPTGGPKSGIGDLAVLDPDLNPTLLETLRNNVVMLGLNRSRSVHGTFLNFHPQYSEAQDYKIRYAFAGTPFYGAYMTDLIKELFEVKSGNLMRHLAEKPSLVTKNIQWLLEELDDLKCAAPTLIAFGGDTYLLAAKHVPPDRYSRLVRVTHYSHYISKEEYRRSVLAELAV